MEKWMINDVLKKIQSLTVDDKKFSEKQILKINRITEWALKE